MFPAPWLGIGQVQWLLFACLLGHSSKVPSSQPAGQGKVNLKKKKKKKSLDFCVCPIVQLFKWFLHARSFPLHREKHTTQSQRASWQHMVLLGGGCKPCAGGILFIPVWMLLFGDRISRMHLSEQAQQWYGGKRSLCAALRT